MYWYKVGTNPLDILLHDFLARYDFHRFFCIQTAIAYPFLEVLPDINLRHLSTSSVLGMYKVQGPRILP